MTFSTIKNLIKKSLDGRRVWGRMDTCICMAEFLHCSPETIATLLTRYTPRQILKFKENKKNLFRCEQQNSTQMTEQWREVIFSHKKAYRKNGSLGKLTEWLCRYQGPRSPHLFFLPFVIRLLPCDYKVLMRFNWAILRQHRGQRTNKRSSWFYDPS